MPRNLKFYERKEGTRLMASLLVPKPEPDECRFLVEIIGVALEDVVEWLYANCSDKDFWFGGRNAFQRTDVEFRHQEDLNFFVLHWKSQNQGLIEIIVNEPV